MDVLYWNNGDAVEFCGITKTFAIESSVIDAIMPSFNPPRKENAVKYLLWNYQTAEFRKEGIFDMYPYDVIKASRMTTVTDVCDELPGTDCPAEMCDHCHTLIECGVNYCSNCGSMIIGRNNEN